MDLQTRIILFLVIILFFLMLLVIFLVKNNIGLKEKLKELHSLKRSGEVKHGKAWEEFVPFLKSFPYDKERFKFIGDPIDGIVFEDNRIAIVEIKTGSSKMSAKQKRVQELVELGRVEFKELRY